MAGTLLVNDCLNVFVLENISIGIIPNFYIIGPLNVNNDNCASFKEYSYLKISTYNLNLLIKLLKTFVNKTNFVNEHFTNDNCETLVTNFENKAIVFELQFSESIKNTLTLSCNEISNLLKIFPEIFLLSYGLPQTHLLVLTEMFTSFCVSKTCSESITLIKNYSYPAFEKNCLQILLHNNKKSDPLHIYHTFKILKNIFVSMCKLYYLELDPML